MIGPGVAKNIAYSKSVCYSNFMYPLQIIISHCKIIHTMEKDNSYYYNVIRTTDRVQGGAVGSCLPTVDSLQYRTLIKSYVLMSSAHKTTRHDMTCTMLEVMQNPK